MKSKKYFIILAIFIALFGLKLWLNALLLAENGDTYDFFKIGKSIQQNNWLYESKRMPFLPLLLATFPPDWFVWVGRIWINLFYFASILVFYKIVVIQLNGLAVRQLETKLVNRLTGQPANLLSLMSTAIFATNIIIFENSFYILADTIFLFFNLLYIYCLVNKKDNPFLLASITALAFYTRPEGFILGIVTTIHYFLKHKRKNIILYTTFTGILLIPNFTRNYILAKTIFASGYFNDAAGFIFDFETILKRFSNFFFLTGGIFLLPLTVLLAKIDLKRIKQIIIDPLFLIFILNSIVLFLWGPYPRLYSVPAAILIIFLTKIALMDVKKDKLIKVVTFTIFVILSVFYLYVSQSLNHNDFGYKKYSKLASIVISFIIIILPILKARFKIPYNKFIVIFAILVVILNLAVFFDKFRYTRYKYYSIKSCVQNYINVKGKEKLAYSTLSGLEEWYLKDETKKYQYLGSIKQFDTWRIENNVNYILTSFESGHKDNLGHIGLKKYTKHEILCEVRTPFFEGSTKLIRLD